MGKRIKKKNVKMSKKINKKKKIKKMDLLFSNYFILCFIFIILGILLFYFSIKIKEKNSILEALFSLILIASMVSIFSMLLGTVLLGALISFIYIGSVVILFLFCIMMLDLHEKQRISIITNVKRVFFLKIKEYKKNYLDKYLDNILLFICIFLFSTKLIIYIYFPMRETYYLDEIYQTNKNNFIYSSADTKANDLDNLQLDNYLDPYNYFGFLQNISSIFTDYIS